MKNCIEIQKELAAYYYRELPEEESSRIEAHLETCQESHHRDHQAAQASR